MSFKRNGIDVSAWQDTIDWDVVKKHVDFVIIRAGYGQNHIDSQFKRNQSECERLGIPYGVYWFSYALTEADAKREANFCCDLLKNHNPTYPVCFDYESDSFNHAMRNHADVTKKKLIAIAKAFLRQVEKRGYYAMNYSNPDFLNRGFSELKKYDLWLAHWTGKKPSRDCGIWQSTSHYTVAGISGYVDRDFAYKDYPFIIKEMNNKRYNIIVNEILEGKWGNGEERKTKLEAAGYSYPTIQELVNKKIIACNNVAHEVIEGLWGNGEERKVKLEKAGYPYSFVQSLVNAYLKAGE